MNLEEVKKSKEVLQILGVATPYPSEVLKTRNSDQLDFHELSVHQIVDLIEFVYEEGFAQGKLQGIREHALQDYYKK